MTPTGLMTMIAAGSMSRVPWYLLGGGALLLSLTLIYFIMSHRGATKSLSKCVLLSVWAHVILLGFAYLTHWFPAPAGVPNGTGEVRVRWISDDASGEDDFEVDGLSPSTNAPSMSEPPNVAADERPSEMRPMAIDPDSVSDVLPELLPELLPEPDTFEPDLLEPDLLESDLVESEVPESSTMDVPLVDDARPTLIDELVPEMDAEMTPAERVSPELPAEAAALATIDETEPVGPNDSAPESRLDEPVTDDADAEYVFSSTDAPGTLGQPRDAASLAAASPPPQSAPAAAAPQLLRSLAMPPTRLPARYAGRSTENRRKLAEAKGGSVDTEAAVEMALQWLVQAQNPQDGRWDNRAWEGGRETRKLGGITHGIKADTATTGLALLAFLGAGHSHRDGPYQETIRHGLEFLMQSQSVQTGSLSGDASRYVAMYCHGIATLAMSEAMIMTDDPQLRRPLVLATEYTIRSQHRVTGGWRYHPGDVGDTSQFGWQLMALVSAESAGIPIPENTWIGARRWLNRVTFGQAGGLACYTPDRQIASPSMTAEALFCRALMLGTPRDATREEAADYVSSYGARLEARNDLYFCYYATLALYQLQDHRWQRWNDTLTHHLVASQQTAGSLAGSWDANTKWGPTGGRVYTTSMACLCLEVYYRYLPVFELAATRGRGRQYR